MFQLHESTALIPPQSNEPVEIDNNMVPLIRALWAKGWQTMACCQDNGEAVEAERAHGPRDEPTGHQGFIEYHKGLAWIKMPVPDALSLLAKLCQHETFGPRVRIRWQRGSWRMHIPVIYQEGQLGPARYVQIYFPNVQIAELTLVIRALGPIAS
jgi:hypothetical protein